MVELELTYGDSRVDCTGLELYRSQRERKEQHNCNVSFLLILLVRFEEEGKKSKRKEQKWE